MKQALTIMAIALSACASAGTESGESTFGELRRSLTECRAEVDRSVEQCQRRECVDKDSLDADSPAFDHCLERCKSRSCARRRSCKDDYDLDYEIAMGHPPASADDEDECGNPSPDPTPDPVADPTPAGRPGPTPDDSLSCVVERPTTSQSVVLAEFVADGAIPFTGFTSFEGGAWHIRFRVNQWNQLDETVRRFLFVHECGHVNMPNSSMMKEVAANCWAARHLAGTFGPVEWAEIRQTLVTFYPRPMPPYPEGNEQYRLMQQCISSP